MGTNVYTQPAGYSSMSICAAGQVQDFCRRIQPYSFLKARQVELILSEPPSAKAKRVLQSMHGNQGSWNPAVPTRAVQEAPKERKFPRPYIGPKAGVLLPSLSPPHEGQSF
ncbi:unnamed protein product [Prorocentrum cordatum]|uniref:Uncharacterized protein n=1 Tax=Prorocentrum cordatum TaxID=2364126 RepID=A0ABN9PJK4_9DINO|nr:unnamed protein product [Polarella glacialis]